MSVYNLGRIVSSSTIASADTNVGDLLFDSATGALSIRAQNAVTGAPVEVVIATLANGAAATYVPTVLADWSGVAPLTIQNALNRIAAAVGPIA